MILQAQDIIKDALGIIGVTAIDEAPSANDISVGLRTLNVMIDSWSARRLMLRSTATDVLSLVSGTYLYTVGTSVSPPNFAVAKPIQIISAFIRDSGGNDDALTVISREEYNGLHDKSISSGRPTHLMYDPGNTQQTNAVGQIAVYLIPDQAYTLTLESYKYLTEFVAPTDTVTLDPAYYEAMIYNLVVRLYRRYHEHGKPIPAEIITLAHTSLRVIETMNAVTTKAGMELPGRVVSFNVYTDQYFGG